MREVEEAAIQCLMIGAMPSILIVGYLVNQIALRMTGAAAR